MLINIFSCFFPVLHYFCHMLNYFLPSWTTNSHDEQLLYMLNHFFPFSNIFPQAGNLFPCQTSASHEVLKYYTLFCDIPTVLLKKYNHKYSDKVTYNGLYPVHSASVNPNKISRFLNVTIHGNVLLVQILQYRPPRSSQVVCVVPETFVQCKLKCQKCNQRNLDRTEEHVSLCA